MTAFFAFMMVCSLSGEAKGQCSILEGPGSPFTTQEACQTELREGQKAVKEDAQTWEMLLEGQAEVRFVCHPAKQGWKSNESYETLMRLYGPSKGEDAKWVPSTR
jgi:hypothetical protein